MFQYDQLVSASARGTHGQPLSREENVNVSARSAPASSLKDGTSSNKNSGIHPEQGSSSQGKSKPENSGTQSKTKSEKIQKRESTRLERKDSVNAQKHSRSMTNMNGNALSDQIPLNSKLVDTYHIPDATQNLQEGFKGGKLQHESEAAMSKQGKQGKAEKDGGMAGKSELHYSSATDLSQPHWYNINGAANGYKPSGGRRKGAVSGTMPRSASSGSSRDENEFYSEAYTMERYDRVYDKDRNEVGLDHRLF